MGKHRTKHTDDALAMVLLALDAIDRGEPIPAGAAEPLAKGLRKYLEGQGPLDKCLGLRARPGSRTMATRYREWKRNRHIRRAHALCEGDSDWARSCSLANEVHRFESIIWPRQTHLSAPPAGASELRSNLFHAFKTGLPVPATAPGIHNITKPAPYIHFAGDEENGDCEQPNLEE